MSQAIKILTIVGARAQFVKAAMVSRAIARHNQTVRSPRLIEEMLHTGQHYDYEMSQIFFDELGIPQPAVNLHVGSGPQGETTGRMLAGIESEIIARRPDWVLVYGDTNSTLAGALAAAKLHVPVAHVEAGLRSYNKKMPEEINRALTDHMSTLLLCPTRQAVQNLMIEGITAGVCHVGDVMYDAALVFGDLARRRSRILSRLGLTPQNYYLATIHRPENTDSPTNLEQILRGLSRLSHQYPVVLPLHPRTRKSIDYYGLGHICNGVRILTPVPFLDMARLEQEARTILTDSGGIQKEAYFHRVPCVTMRDETEWLETVAAGWNQMVGADSEKIQSAVAGAAPGRVINEYGNGDASFIILDYLMNGLVKRPEEVCGLAPHDMALETKHKLPDGEPR
ncbi:MAG: UDP-N-acetylglucosamine 2-epimerase (non-hydrolyzing) [Deltaproteobacteria bacterium]|nr:UDP-N-acetylglucosamine 2-epimerase (non-hydrolyzing) [Deltaproteobacteria bacterium]